MENKTINNIIKKYDSYLVEIKNIPRLFARNIICVQSFKDLLNAKKNTNKPIYYIVNNNCCDFIYTENDIYIYTIKGNNIDKSLVEKHLDKLDKSDFNIINNIKDSSYVTGNDGSEYIIMPIKDENEKTII